MIFRYRIIMYLRTTDREGGIIDIPARHVQQVLSIAGISNPAELGESDEVSQQAGDQEPQAAFHGEQDAPAQHQADQQINRNRSDEFHGTENSQK